MQGKTPRETSVILSHLILPEDANPAGNAHGGVILKYIDTAGGIVAKRHARGNVVTASIDRTDFLAPVFVGEMVTLKASLNFVGRTSMEVGVRVEAENLETGEVRHTNSAYIIYVALDGNARPRAVPPLILETAEDHRRNCEANMRREARRKAREMEACSGRGLERQ
jgi:acyl-CoA hydrolase